VHVLVAEHNPERARTLASTLTAAGHRVEIVSAGGAALALLARPGPPDVALVEERMPDMTAFDFLQAAARMSASVPVVVLGPDPGAARWVESGRLGVLDFVLTDAEGAYLSTLSARLQATARRAGTHDRVARLADALASTAAAFVLADRAGTIEHVNAAAARLLGRRTPEAVRGTLTDLFALEDDARVKADLTAAIHVGGEWAGEVKVATEGGERVPCMLTLSPVRRSAGRVDGLVLTLRDVSDRVAMEEALRAANRRLAEQASRDPLTQLYNRGYFREVLGREVARSARYRDELSVLMIDVDGFKRINDDLDHSTGDQVLQEIGRALRDGLRDGDVLARYGGDEFCVLLPSTPREGARAVAERLRTLVSSRGYGPSGTIKMRITLGLATSADVNMSEKTCADAMLRLADRALLSAKPLGGDRVVAHGDPAPTR
jgi:diguanylate cyclase (GGDEF)-like protein/PAS domain S-box-containing protein